MSTPHPANPRSLFTPKSAEIPLKDRPLDLDFVLPDSQSATVQENEAFNEIRVLQSSSKEEIAKWTRTEGEQARVSLHGVVQDQRAQSEDVWKLALSGSEAIVGEKTVNKVWIAVYAFWLRRDPYERLPIQVTSRNEAEQQFIVSYLVHTGLALRAPDAKSPAHLLLVKASFYQGAGAPLSLSWLRAPEPHPTSFGPLASAAFPSVLSFTSKTSPPVLTTHPLRPPKPAPGTVVYSRFIPSVGEFLELTHIDAENPVHFEAYSRWQNSDRVNVGWREKGNEEHHRIYIRESLADPHKMGYVVSWNGQLAGYGEANYNKEDGMAAFVGGCEDYDQGTHLLIGEEKFRGRHRFASIMVSMKHMCFLREPRTNTVIGEPRYDLPIIPLLKAYLPQDVVKEVELPHKRAVYFVLKRERFFLEGQFY